MVDIINGAGFLNQPEDGYAGVVGAGGLSRTRGQHTACSAETLGLAESPALADRQPAVVGAAVAQQVAHPVQTLPGFADNQYYVIRFTASGI